MAKKHLFITAFACAMTQPVSAAYITSTTTNGNSVNDFASSLGLSEFEVTFNNMQSVQINFDNSFSGLISVQDNIAMNIYNNTGAGWSGFDFTLVGVGMFGPFNFVLNTGTFSTWQFHENDPATGLAAGVMMTFGDLEEIGLYDVFGSVDTSFSQTYSLILTPTTVPVPAAVWLFGSGLLGLIGIARRKSKCMVG